MPAPRLLVAFFAVLLAACVPPPPDPPAARATIAGVLSGETVPAGEVEMAGDVLVPAGATLRIEPGTTVRVRPSESTKIDPEYLSPLTELLVRGSLHIAGTPQRPVRFLPAAPPGDGEVAWAGILLDGATESALEGAVVEDAETGLLCIATSPLVRDSRLSRCRYGLVAQQGSSPRVHSCRIEDGEGGVFCWAGATPILVENRIAGHEEEGVFVDRSSRPRLEGNEITGNAIGLALYPRDLAVDGNRVSGNGEDVRLLGSGGEGE